jgi:DNA-binding transcriptional LysR family regulator
MAALVELGSYRDSRLRPQRALPAAARRGAHAHNPVRAPRLTELRALCAALELGSISRAARLLQLSQPALSKRLRGLEAVAGTQLLERSTSGVTSTPAGERLYHAARRLLAEADALDDTLHDLCARTAPVRVAASPTVAESLLPQVLVELESRQDRHLSVELTTGNSAYVELGLAAIDPDIDSGRGLVETVIWHGETVVAVPADHPWAEVDAIEPEEFARTPIVRSDPGAHSSLVVDAALRRIGLEQVRPLAEIGNTTAAVGAALAAGAPVLLPVDVASARAGHGLVVRRVRGLSFEQRFGLLSAGSLHSLTPSARALAEHILGLAPAHDAAPRALSS